MTVPRAFYGWVVGPVLLLALASACSRDSPEVEALRERVEELEAQASVTPAIGASMPPAASPSPSAPTPAASLATATRAAAAGHQQQTDWIALLDNCLLGRSLVALDESTAKSVGLTSAVLAERYVEKAARKLADLEGAGCLGIGSRAAGEPQASAECAWVLGQLTQWELLQKAARQAGTESQGVVRALEELWAFDRAAC